MSKPILKDKRGRVAGPTNIFHMVVQGATDAATAPIVQSHQQQLRQQSSFSSLWDRAMGGTH